METKPTLYYVQGVAGRGDEICKLLEEKGGKRPDDFEEDMLGDIIYFINHNGEIDYTFDYDKYRYNFIIHYGTELTLPKPKVYKWEDIEDEWGTLLEGVRFPTDQQYESVVAASKIAQVRYFGEDIYGKIVPKDESAFPIIGGEKTRVDTADWYNRGGLLRFETKWQAELFLKNNKELVEAYLKTFS